MPDSNFPKTHRLLRPREFQAVFDGARFRASDRHLLLLARRNDRDNPRLGLIIAKRHLKRAVDRNRVKRQIRESFRHQQQALTGLDIIVLARAGLHQLDNPQLRQRLDSLWQKLIHQKNKASAENS